MAVRVFPFLICYTRLQLVYTAGDLVKLYKYINKSARTIFLLIELMVHLEYYVINGSYCIN